MKSGLEMYDDDDNDSMVNRYDAEDQHNEH